MNKLLVIVGPTAVGKTEIAIEVAQLIDTDIISADSRQFYKELNIGVAKPTEDQLAKVKHHFINSISVTDEYNVGMFEKDSLDCLAEIYSSNNCAVMVGGSGLFIRAVCEGLDDLPDGNKEVRERLNNEFEKNGVEYLSGKLKEVDIEYYNEVDVFNHRRIIRALEVYELTGHKFSSFRNGNKTQRPFEVHKIGLDLDREVLYERINKRVDLMIENGLIEEARNLYPQKNLSSLQTIGYTELFDFFDGNISEDEAIDLIKQNSRKYAKRQMTWFRKDKDIEWFDPQNKEAIIKYVRSTFSNYSA
ncbi:MAG: tRNA (adenosine(37)-N6)-dimethylallyltransferase MiaA [Bacteroidia bacterium]|nr:tRNA (adenosine(37)-N6)-dimethylallyltransferase MiaA [Bacteroidia bacterium]